MTVADLIKKLQTLPQDHIVIIDNGSDYYPLAEDPENIQILPAWRKEICLRPEQPGYTRYVPHWWPKDKDKEPVFVDCVLLTL